MLDPLQFQAAKGWYCVLCLQNTVKEQLEAVKKGVPIEEIMVTSPNPALTMSAVQVPTGKGTALMALPVCQLPQHLGVKI